MRRNVISKMAKILTCLSNLDFCKTSKQKYHCRVSKTMIDPSTRPKTYCQMPESLKKTIENTMNSATFP